MSRRPPAVISSVPEGYAIHRSIVRDGYWLAALDLADNLKAPAPPDAKLPATIQRSVQTVRVRATQAVQFVGVESAKPVGESEYEVQVQLPGGFGVAWAEPLAVSAGHAVGSVPAVGTAHDRLSGVVYAVTEKANVAAAPACPTSQETSMTWLLKLPAEPQRLVFEYGSDHGYGDGANYVVRVNGRQLWKEYRPQVSPDPEEAKAHKAPPPGSGAVDLSAYAGQTVILELAFNPHTAFISETHVWRQPHLEARLLNILEYRPPQSKDLRCRIVRNVQLYCVQRSLHRPAPGQRADLDVAGRDMRTIRPHSEINQP